MLSELLRAALCGAPLGLTAPAGASSAFLLLLAALLLDSSHPQLPAPSVPADSLTRVLRQAENLPSGCFQVGKEIFPLNRLLIYSPWKSEFVFFHLPSMQKAWDNQRQIAQGGEPWKPQQKIDFLQSNGLWERGAGVWN